MVPVEWEWFKASQNASTAYGPSWLGKFVEQSGTNLVRAFSIENAPA